MKPNNMYLYKREVEKEFREGVIRDRVRAMCLDYTVIALGRMGFDLDKMFEFRDNYCEVEKDFALMIVDEHEEELLAKDKVGGVWVSKARIDKAVREVLGENVAPFDERYSQKYAEPWTEKDAVIHNLQKLVEKKNDEIIKLKAQMKLIKEKNNAGRKS